MAKVVETAKSPFQRAQEEDRVADSTTENATTKKKGRPPAGTPDWAPLFIGALMEGESVRKAARIAGVNVTMPFHRRKTDECFKRSWREAANIGTELMEQEAARRAFHGTIKPVFHKGEECGSIREYSDTLMIFLLKARRPDKYREGIEDVVGRGNMTVNINVVNVDKIEDVQGIPLTVVDGNNQQDHTHIPEAVPVP